MTVYIVYNQFYQDKEVEKIFLSEEQADKYSGEQNEKYHSHSGWGVSSYDVENEEEQNITEREPNPNGSMFFSHEFAFVAGAKRNVRLACDVFPLYRHMLFVVRERGRATRYFETYDMARNYYDKILKGEPSK